MKIIQLELYKYTRFMLKGIEYFRYCPETIIQIILGPNGSGKSSLLKELSPLPADLKAEFAPSGYKKIKLSHNGAIYDLLSERGDKGNVFSFVKDGAELNPGHTVSVFRDLVRTEFGITPEIHELMIGSLRFTAMDSGTRRSWFTRLPSTDYNYAIRYYKKLSERFTNTRGAIKHLSGRLLQEKEKEVTSEELAELKEDLVHLKDYLTFLLETKRASGGSVEEANTEIERSKYHIKRCITEMSNAIRRFSNETNATSIADLAEHLTDVKASIAAVSKLAEDVFNRADKLEQSIDELVANNANSFEQLQQKMSERKAYIATILGNVKNDLGYEDVGKALEALNSVAPYLIEILNELDPDEARMYGREQHVRLTEKKAALERKESDLKEIISFNLIKKKEFEHLKEHNTVECPECSHKFVHSYNQGEYDTLLGTLEINYAQAKQVADELKVINDQLTYISERFEKLRDFSQLAKGQPAIEPFWNYIRSNILFNNPRGIVQAVESARQDLLILNEVALLLKDEKYEQETMKMFLEHKNSSIEDLRKEYETLSTQMSGLLAQKVELEAKQKRIERSIERYKHLQEIKLWLETNLEIYRTNMSSIEDTIRNELRGKMINQVQLEITTRENRISSITSHKTVIKEFETQLDVLGRERDMIKAAMDVLSPSEGLIAKGITGFINHFCGQMNNFIRKIWSYPLEITTIVPDENLDLDYKFKVKIGDQGSSPDIAKLSRGQQEIIDLAFRVISAQYLGLGHFPLYLDEFGSSFDKDHRQSVAEMMTTLTSTSTFSQIYIISHYEEMYGSFKNTDITIFHDPSLESMADSAFNKIATFA